MKLHYVACLATFGLVTGCTESTLIVKPEPVNPISKHATDIYKDLSERIGHKYDGSDLNVATQTLKEISTKALNRYNSNVPEDVAKLSLKPVYLKNSNGFFKMRSVSLVISRGDSRVVQTSDIKALYSGVTTNLRVTLALDSSIFINGVKIGNYSPSDHNFYDVKVPDFTDGSISLRVNY